MRLTGWRYGVFVSCLVGFVGTHCYFTMIRPMIDPEPYKQMRQHLAEKNLMSKKPTMDG